METIKVEVAWSNKNYCGGWGHPEIGAVLATGKSLEQFKEEFQSALDFQVEGLLADGDTVPQWLLDKDYKIEYELQVSALLRSAERFTTMAVLSRITGINQRLLSNYASDVKKPRPAQREKIIAGIHEIGRQCLTLC